MIYFDNAATTYPKPAAVTGAVLKAMTECGANPGRGGYRTAEIANETVFKTRELAAELFGAEPENIVFTKNCTEALNFAIKGVLFARYRGHVLHVVTSNLEHNSVLRPLETLKKMGVCDYSVVKVGDNDDETVKRFKDSVRRNTVLFVCTNASNSFGTVLPVKEIGKIARERGIKFIVDCAQTAGSLDITLDGCNADMLCMPGHKALFGPMGTGLLVTRGERMATILEGGTGSVSSFLSQPDFYPDRFEAGTLNLIGIAGLYEGMRFASQKMPEENEREMEMLRFIYKNIEDDRIELYTPTPQSYRQMPVLSFNVKGKDSGYIGEMLGREDIAVRTGFHCAYPSHRFYGTADKGTVRISLSRMNTQKEAAEFIDRLKKLLNNS